MCNIPQLRCTGPDYNTPVDRRTADNTWKSEYSHGLVDPTIFISNRLTVIVLIDRLFIHSVKCQTLVKRCLSRNMNGYIIIKDILFSFTHKKNTVKTRMLTFEELGLQNVGLWLQRTLQKQQIDYPNQFMS